MQRCLKAILFFLVMAPLVLVQPEHLDLLIDKEISENKTEQRAERFDEAEEGEKSGWDSNHSNDDIPPLCSPNDWSLAWGNYSHAALQTLAGPVHGGTSIYVLHCCWKIDC